MLKIVKRDRQETILKFAATRGQEKIKFEVYKYLSG
jgi:hypothetical protein